MATKVLVRPQDVQADLNLGMPLRKHAYSSILKILPPKNENFQIKILIFFHISAQSIDYGYLLEPEAVLTSTHNLCF